MDESNYKRLTPVKGPCSICGEVIPKEHKSRVVCSWRCHGRKRAGKLDAQPCDVCGVSFRPSNNEASCSESCKLEKRRKIHRDSKAKSRATDQGKQAQYLANRKYLDANSSKVNEYVRNKRKSDPVFRMSCLLRGMLHKVLSRQNKRKNATCVDLVGYTGLELKEHIEKQFSSGMSWDLVGAGIHIDHIVSVAELMRRGETSPKVINALSNLRPMWAKDNIQKSDKSTHLL